MKRIAFWILVFGLSGDLLSQETIIIDGKVVDSNTKKPVPFATISLLNTNKGSVANKEGAFDLIATVEDSIRISSLGYTPLSLSLQSILTSNQKVFELDRQSIMLNEVVVTGERKQLSGDEILKFAIKNQKKNFPQNDYSLSVFFRETNRVDDEYFKLVEAAATVQGKKYPNTSKKILIDEIRSASQLDLSIPVNTEMGNYNPFREFQSLVGRVGNVRACRSCKYQVEDYITHEGQILAVITSKGTNEKYPRIFRYFIDLESYAVVKMEFETEVPFGDGFPYSHENFESSLVYLKRTIEYKVSNGKYYLSRYHQRGTHQYNAKDSLSDSYQTTHDFHVITNNITAGKTELGNESNEMSYKTKISEARKTYNPDFWRNYNILKQTPLDQKILRDLQKKKPADSLFSKKN